MVSEWVKAIAGGSPLEVGKRYHHPGGVITVVSGQYWGKHGLSNFWTWTDENGTEHRGYGDDWKEVIE